MTQHQTTGASARLKRFALLAARGVRAAEVDDLVAAVEAEAVAGAQSEVVERDGMVPASRSEVFAEGLGRGRDGRGCGVAAGRLRPVN